MDLSAVGPDVVSKALAGVLTTAMIGFVGYLKSEAEKRIEGQRERRKNDQAIREALESIQQQTALIPTIAESTKVLLRTELVREYRKWMPLGYITLEGKEHITDVYDQYHGGLHANGVGTSMYEAMMELSIKEEER